MTGDGIIAGEGAKCTVAPFLFRFEPVSTLTDMGGEAEESSGGLTRDAEEGAEALVDKDLDDSSFLTIASAVSLDPTLK